MGGLLNKIYSAFTLKKVIDYDNAYVYGNKKDIDFEVTTSKLFATHNGSESSFDIRIRTISKR